MPTVTYIVSAYDRPLHLRGCLASLQVQTDPDFEVIVADNGGLEHNAIITGQMNDERFRYINTGVYTTTPAWDCYWSAEWVVEHEAKGEWICLPSDDSYYMPIFQQVCMEKAKLNNWQLVFPNMLYDRRLNGSTYSVLDTSPHSCRIDKCGFFIRRDVWIGFPGKPQGYRQSSCCDGEMIQQVVERGARWGKIEECLVIHN